MKKAISIVVMILFIAGGMSAQESEKTFKASGKPFIKVFTNFHSTFEDGMSQQAFEIQRAYFGYSYNLNENFSGKVTLDFADPGVGKLKMTAFLKYAYFQYKKDRFKVKFGLIGLNQFKKQEDEWGSRYLYKSFQDQHKYGYSADLGIFASYKINKNLTIDATIANGEGFKNLESDSLLKYSLGITVGLVKGLDFRAYYDFMGTDDVQQTLSFFLGYKNDGFRGGAEYNYQLNNQMSANKDLTGLSFYASYNFEKIRVFGRYDHLSSNTIGQAMNPWHNSKDGSALIAGIEFNPVKGIKISPNFQSWIPKDDSPSVTIAYLSCEISF